MGNKHLNFHHSFEMQFKGYLTIVFQLIYQLVLFCAFFVVSLQSRFYTMALIFVFEVNINSPGLRLFTIDLS